MLRHLPVLPLLPLLLATAACSSSSSSATPGGADADTLSVSGTVGDMPFEAMSAVFAVATGGLTAPAGSLQISLSTRAGFCTNLGDANANELDLLLPPADAAVGTVTFSGSESPGVPSAGYSINTLGDAPDGGGGTFLSFNDQSGSLTITSMTSDTLTGTFDITFGTGGGSMGSTAHGGELTGTFVATSCPALAQ
jgi:hypothetical protein